MALKPGESVIAAAVTALAVVEIFHHTTPPTADVQASAAGGTASKNTFTSVKTATLESAVLVGGVGLLARDPTIYLVGAVVIIWEAWKAHAANVTVPGAPPGTVAAPGSMTPGQPVLNG